jgi:RNA polymerase sigma-70 factor (ECF subfamily)
MRARICYIAVAMASTSASPNLADPQLRPEALEAHRVALTGHCYRMLGSAAEADDAVQEAMVRAWRALDRFEARSSLKTWLYRIATRVCLDMLGQRARRERPMELGPVGTIEDELTLLPGDRWLEPIPDLHAVPGDADPAERVVLRQSIRLAFVAALQHLPPRQRAALLLTEVLGLPVAEVAEGLETTVAAVNSALQRARATLAARDLGERRGDLSDAQSDLLERYVDAFERYDVSTLTRLLHQDATLSMPPYSLWLRGPDTISKWMLGRGSGCRGSRLLPTAACGSPAFGQYRPAPGGGHTAWALVVLELAGDRIATMNFFLDVATWFPRFGLPMALEPA